MNYDVDYNTLWNYISKFRVLIQLNKLDENKEFLIEFYNIMKYEWNRLMSYDNSWDNTILPAEQLAAAGFFHLIGNKVMCVFCKGQVSDWEREEDPRLMHAYHFPLCPFVMNDDVGNIPIKSRNQPQ